MGKHDFTKRAVCPELMDLADVDEQKLLRTVWQFALLNRLFSSSRRLICSYFLDPLIREGKQSFSLLDIGAGGCDIPIWIVQYCRKHGISPNITCIDYDARILAYARRQCDDYPEIRILHHDALQMQDLGKFDYIYANNFLHHLDDVSVSRVLQQTADMAQRGYMLNDIYRSRMAYWLYTLFAGLFLHRSFAFYDGRLSIRKGFTASDLRLCIRNACLDEEPRVLRTRFFRIVVVHMKRAQAASA